MAFAKRVAAEVSNGARSPASVTRPVASILLLAYNHEPFVEAALLSLFRQEIAGCELIVVDDASSDGTRAMIELTLARAAPPGLAIRKIFKERNGGVLAAMNEAMAMASGRIFIAMAGDDISLPDRLSRTLRHFADSPDVQLVYGEFIKVDVDGRVWSKQAGSTAVRRFTYDHAPFGRIYASSTPFGASAAYRRELYDFFGPMIAGTHGEDNCYWVRALLLGAVVLDPACYVHWRQHRGNLSNFAASKDDDEWRRRHLAWMELHATMSPQWLVDIQLARDRGFITRGRYWRLRLAAAREDATWSLEASSLRLDSWSEWLRHAFNLVRLGRFATTIRFLKLRCSQRRRERRWQQWLKLKSNP